MSQPWSALLVVSLLGLALRLWGLGDRSFWLDELISVGRSARGFGEFLLALTFEANMTLYHWALFLWLRIVGITANETLIRLPSAIIGAAGIPLIYLLGRRLHSPAAGLAAAGLLAVNGFHILMSQQARSYALLSSLTILSYLMLERALQRRRWWDWALHGVVTAMAFYSHFYTAFTVLAQAAFVLSRRSRAAFLGFIGSGVLMALLLAQLIPYLLRQSRESKLAHVLPPDLEDAVTFMVGLSGGSPGTLALYVGLAAIGIGWIGHDAGSGGKRNWLLLTWLVMPLGLVFGVSLLTPIFQARYLFAILPALPLLAGVGLARLPRAAGVTAFCLLAGLSLWAIQGDFEVQPGESVRPGEQWRQAVSYARTNAREGDGWIFISKWGQEAFEYYAGWHWGRNPAAPYDHILEPFYYQQALSVQSYRGMLSMAELEQFTSTHPRIWLVQSHQSDRSTGVDAAAPVREWLTSHGYRQRTSREFRRIRLLIYERSGS